MRQTYLPSSATANAIGGNRFSRCWPELALGLLVFGSRLSALSYAGSALPYYDQWLAEFNNVYLQLLGGSSVWSALILPHNEHVLLTAKVASWLGFQLNGYWDVQFLTVVAALVRGLTAALTFRLLTDGFGAKSKALLWMTVVAVFAIPYSAYNVLCGLQVSFYFADLFLLISLFTVLRWNSASRSGAQLVGASLLGLLSMGSAVAIPAATFAVHLASRRRRPGFWFAWIVTALMTAVYAVVLTGLQTARLAMPPLGDRIAFFLSLFSWPIMNGVAGAFLLAFAAIVLTWACRQGSRGPRPFPAIVGLGTAAVVNILLIAAHRPPDGFHMRHWETVAAIPLCLLALTATVAARLVPGLPSIRWAAGPIAFLYLIAGTGLVVGESLPYLTSAHERREEVNAHYVKLLTSSRLLSEARARINGQLSVKDYTFFDDPIGRFVPHPVVIGNILLNPPAAHSLLAPEIVHGRSPSAFSRVTRLIGKTGWIFCLAGAIVLIVGLNARPQE